jgi:hypothetical protein
MSDPIADPSYRIEFDELRDQREKLARFCVALWLQKPVMGVGVWLNRRRRKRLTTRYAWLKGRFGSPKETAPPPDEPPKPAPEHEADNQ